MKLILTNQKLRFMMSNQWGISFEVRGHKDINYDIFTSSSSNQFCLLNQTLLFTTWNFYDFNISTKMVLSQESSPSNQYPDAATSTSCRFNNIPAYQGYPAYPSQPQDLSLNAADCSHQANQAMLERYQARPVEDWLSNVYYPGVTHTLPSSIYHYRYNPYQMYDFSNYSQGFHHQYGYGSTISPPQHNQTSTSPISSIGSTSPPEHHMPPTVSFDWMKTTSSNRPRGKYAIFFYV